MSRAVSRPAALAPDLADAYAKCADITRRQARNFSYGIALLPPPKRRAMTAVYAVARRIDDIGDGDLPPDTKRSLLEQARSELAALSERVRPEPFDKLRTAPVEGRVSTGSARRPFNLPPSADPILTALADASSGLPIPLEAFQDLIDGCIADVSGRHYDDFDSLVWYCRRVAGSIGRLSVGVYDAVDDAGKAFELADSLGVALQLTNILRDVREDRHNGRIYLPQEDLDHFGCRLPLDDAGNLADPSDRFAALIRFEALRARRWYEDGLRLLPLLDHRSAACTAAMAGIYRRLLDKITAAPAAVTMSRLSLTGPAKLAVAVRAVTVARA
jgi:phytoene synthase